MNDGPAIARIAALIGDHARAEILSALVAGPALTATELAAFAGVTKQTASAHLSKLTDAQLVAVEQQGRHRYFRLADRDVAQLLENLMGVAFRAGAVRMRSSPREPALRHARVCYDHLAGELGVMVFDGMVARGLLQQGGGELALTARGVRFCAELGIDVDGLSRQRRSLCRACLDWSARRHHLAGALGASLLSRFVELGWAHRVRASRVMKFSPPGEAALRERFAPRRS